MKKNEKKVRCKVQGQGTVDEFVKMRLFVAGEELKKGDFVYFSGGKVWKVGKEKPKTFTEYTSEILDYNFVRLMKNTKPLV